jgi:hypothetical protein
MTTMNNPTLCEVLVEGQRCDKYSSYVYKSVHVTRLICDDCAARYRHEKSAVPILEFALFELVPARQILVDRMNQTQKALDKLRSLDILRRDQDRRLGFVVLGLAIPTITALAVLSKGWALLVFLPMWVGSSFALHFFAKDTGRKNQAIHDRFGYPELGL